VCKNYPKNPCEITEIPSNLNNDIVNLTKETNAILHLNIPSELLKDKYVPEALCDNEELTVLIIVLKVKFLILLFVWLRSCMLMEV